MAVALELPRPFVGSAAGLHADQARRQLRNESHELVAADEFAQDGAAPGIHAVAPGTPTLRDRAQR